MTKDTNTGNCNTGNWNTGYFNTITPDDVLIFNKSAKRKDWENTRKPDWICFYLTEWVTESEMTDKEKEAYPSYTTTGGFLKVCTSCQHAAIEAWNKTSQEDKELTLKLPNFDDDVFKEIFGFSVLESLEKKTHTIKIDGKEIEISDESFQEFKKSLL